MGGQSPRMNRGLTVSGRWPGPGAPQRANESWRPEDSISSRTNPGALYWPVTARAEPPPLADESGGKSISHATVQGRVAGQGVSSRSVTCHQWCPHLLWRACGAVGGGQPQLPDRHCLWRVKQLRALVAGILDTFWTVVPGPLISQIISPPMACPSDGGQRRGAYALPGLATLRETLLTLGFRKPPTGSWL